MDRVDIEDSFRASVIVNRDEKKLDIFIKHYEDCIRQAGEYVPGEKEEWLDLRELGNRKWGKMSKLILFTQRVLIQEDYGERWDCADQRIAAFIRTCGFVPIPVLNCEESITDFFVAVQPVGIVLTGGNSLVKYGGDAPERDVTDTACIRLAIEQHIPVYGFCRGMQSLLDYFGEKISNVDGHISSRHSVAGIIQREVNSYHGQACMGLRTDNFDVLAKAEDGVIEAVRHRKYPMLGTMWHPEREATFRAEDIRMVRELFEDGEGEDFCEGNHTGGRAGNSAEEIYAEFTEGNAHVCREDTNRAAD